MMLIEREITVRRRIITVNAADLREELLKKAGINPYDHPRSYTVQTQTLEDAATWCEHCEGMFGVRFVVTEEFEKEGE